MYIYFNFFLCFLCSCFAPVLVCASIIIIIIIILLYKLFVCFNHKTKSVYAVTCIIGLTTYGPHSDHDSSYLVCMCIAVEIQMLFPLNFCFASCILQCLLNQQLFQKAIDDAASFLKHKCHMKAIKKMHKIIILIFNRF